jgi:putative ABC transport system permease protein
MPSLRDSLHDLARDLKGALLEMRRKPAFATVVILTLALGLGATTAVFSELYTTVLKPLPYPDPDQLVAVHNFFAQSELSRMPTSVFDYLDLGEQHSLFSNVGVYYFLDLSRTGIARPEIVNAVAVTSSLLRALGVNPMLGRTFTLDEERPNGPHAVILSEAYWRNTFGGDRAVLNRTIELSGVPYRIVGVMPASFQFPFEVTQMWTAVSFQPKELASRADADYYLRMVARLAPGLSYEQASARIGELSRRMALQRNGSGREQSGWKLFLLPFARDNDGSLRRWMTLLFAAVTGLLLVVCSNVAGLLLVRATERQFDFSLRLALGAGRFRIARQALTEVLLLAVCGGAAGLLIAKAAVRALAGYGPSGATAKIESPVFWFGAALTLATGLACGLYPAWNATRGANMDALKQGGHQRTATGGKRRFQQGLIVAQVAVATTLLISGGLLLRSFVHLLDAPLGFNPRGVLTLGIQLPSQRYPSRESRAAFYRELFARVKQIAGVESLSGCSLPPFGYGENVTPFEIAGRPKPRVASYADVNYVFPDYLQTMQIPLLRGRYFDGREHSGSQPVALIDEVLARKYFAGEDPVGQFIRTPFETYRILGVVGGVKVTAIETEAPATVYFSRLQYPATWVTLVIRSNRPAAGLTSDVQSVLTQVDKDEPVREVQTLEDFVNRALKTRRFVVALIAGFGIVAAALSALGLYGVLSYWIAARRRELGIRMALGADARAIATLVCSSGLRLAASGALLGCAGAASVHRYLASQLYGVPFADSTTWLAVAAGILLAGALACILPAWRASRTNVTDALRIG